MKKLFTIIFLVLAPILFWDLSAVAQTRNSIEVKLIMSVDWEGFSLDDINLAAFNKFRDDYPEVKIVHFLNAAYYTQPNANAEEITRKIKSVLRPGDELGLHIHAIESLLQASGVAYREGVTFWGTTKSEPRDGIRGHDVPLSLFTTEEMRKVIHTSVAILNNHGFINIKSFRAGGWIATPEVLDALAQENIFIDSSAVSKEVLANFKSKPLYQINEQLWPEQNVFKTEPYYITTPSGFKILEFPDNVSLADYISGTDTFSIFDKHVFNNFGKTEIIYFHYGFHQENAATYLPDVRYFMNQVRNMTQTYRVQVNSVTLTQ